MQESSSLFLLKDLLQEIQTLENSQLLKYKQIFKSALAARTRLSVDRAVDRPLPPVDRVPNRELGTYS